MNIDILDLARGQKNERAIDIAFPVLAIECETAPLLEDEPDAYEETVLKLVGIGLSAKGIASTLKATESLVENILGNLKDDKGYAEKESGKPWRLTEAGKKYLSGMAEERGSENSKFGYMFVNAIKKEVFPYFYEGDLNQAPLFIGKQLPDKLTLNGSEEDTFAPFAPKRTGLKRAFKKYCKNSRTVCQYAAGDITLDEAIDLFENLDSFDEADEDDEAPTEPPAAETRENRNMLVRALNCPPKHMYLTMRVIIDPAYPGGYRVESPFDLGGIDNGYYLRQVQWLAASGRACIGTERLDQFLTREVRRFAPNFQNTDMDFSVFALSKLPRLTLLKDRFSRVYEDMGQAYALMLRQSSMLEKENVVSSISRYVLESLFNEFFRCVKSETLANVSKMAVDDLRRARIKPFKQMLLQNTALDPERIYWSNEYAEGALRRLKRTRGNSTVEKFINVIALNYYIGTPETRSFLTSDNAREMYELTDKLNKIRHKVSHDTDEPFVAKDYEYYMANVFTLINGLLAAYKEI